MRIELLTEEHATLVDCNGKYAGEVVGAENIRIIKKIFKKGKRYHPKFDFSNGVKSFDDGFCKLRSSGMGGGLDGDGSFTSFQY